MRLFSVIAKLTTWAFMNSLSKYIWLAFLLLLIAIAYPNPTAAQNASSIPTKQTSGKETISGAFGIKFGEDIKPYIKGINPSFGISLMGNFTNYKILKPPVNLKGMFPDVYNLELLGISDDNDRVILLRFGGLLGERSCVNNNVKAINEFLREKYKIMKSQQPGYGDLYLSEEYGDSEGNKIRMSCEEGSLEVKYTSHLMSDYIARLKAKQQKQTDDVKKSLNKGL